VLSDRRLRIWAIGLLPLLVVGLVVTVVVLRGRPSGATSVADGAPGPVLLVSGYGGSTASLDRLAERLRAAGRDAVVIAPIGDNTGDLAAQAQALGADARQRIDAGAASVDVVGYSAGGVVARLWVDRFGGTGLARRVVTLGSPHHGTAVAGLAARFATGACPVACQELAAGSDLLDGLPDTPRGPRWVSIWTADDDVVVPPDSARLDGAVNVELQQVCAGRRVDHGGLPTDPVATALVVAALTRPGLTRAPAPSACAALSGG
jgi:triacylglycerol esterase/lipase EstA (alpha/beta hydrolase family)